jgi:hypothetical protein
MSVIATPWRGVYQAKPKLEPSCPLATIVNCRTASRVRRVDREPLTGEKGHECLANNLNNDTGRNYTRTQILPLPMRPWLLDLHETGRNRSALQDQPTRKTHTIGKRRTPCRISRIHPLLSNGAFATRAENSSTRFGTADFGETPAKPTSKERMISRPCVARRGFFASARSSFAWVSFISAVYKAIFGQRNTSGRGGRATSQRTHQEC